MRSSLSANAVVRTALAVLFGFMSLFHGTVMAFAKANPDGHHAAAAADHVVKADSRAAGHHHAAHRQPAGHEHQPAPAMPGAVSSCYGVGCFIVLDSFAPSSLAVSIRAIATLSPAITNAMVPAVLDPVVPPPRIQA